MQRKKIYSLNLYRTIQEFIIKKKYGQMLEGREGIQTLDFYINYLPRTDLMLAPCMIF